MMTKWSNLEIRAIQAADPAQLHVGDPVDVTAEVHLNGIRPEDVEVQIYSGRLDYEGKFAQRDTVVMPSSYLLMMSSKPPWQLWQGATTTLTPVALSCSALMELPAMRTFLNGGPQLMTPPPAQQQ